MRVEWVDEGGEFRPRLPDRPEVTVAWAPLPGSQVAFLRDRTTEVLIAGNRGGGKSDVLLMSFAQQVGRGYGDAWRGILFRRTYKELEDIEARSHRWFRRIFPDARYNHSSHAWHFKGGETLRLSYFERPSDYYGYHGHEYPWIGWEELTTWPTDECYRSMFSCLRSPHSTIPRQVRATTNPGGVGHNHVKARFRLPLLPDAIVGPLIEEQGQPPRRAIRSSFRENAVLLRAEPDYADKLRAAASSEAQRKAWEDGDWDIVAGGMFDDLWKPDVHVVPPIPPAKIPAGWKLDRSYDDGQTHPFSVGWWAQSSGEPVEWEGRQLGAVRGDLIRVGEWYGWTGQPNKGLTMSPRDIARGILEREQKWGIAGRVRRGPADTAIFNSDRRDRNVSVASEMAKQGVHWEPADKGPGSRIQGWKAVRDMLRGAVPGDHGRREFPGLFISARCDQALRLLPVTARDEKDPDDVDSESEDHLQDEIRYRVRRLRVVDKTTSSVLY